MRLVVRLVCGERFSRTRGALKPERRLERRPNHRAAVQCAGGRALELVSACRSSQLFSVLAGHMPRRREPRRRLLTPVGSQGRDVVDFVAGGTA